MRIQLTLVDPQRDLRTDVLLEARDSTPTAEVLSALRGASGGAPTRARVLGRGPTAPRAVTCYLRGQPLDPTVPVAESGLREGSLVSVSDPRWSVVDGLDVGEGSAQVAEIRVVSGAGAGTVRRLSAGLALVGSDPGCLVHVADERVPPVCAVLRVHHDGSVGARATSSLDAADPSTAGPYAAARPALDQAALAEEETVWERGAQLAVAGTLLELADLTVPDAAVEPSAEPGRLDYNRPPRLLAPERETTFRLPSAPREGQDRGLPWLVMLLPLFLAVAMAVALRRPGYLMMGLFSPLMMLGNHLQSRTQGRRSHRDQVAEFEDRSSRIEADVEAAVVEERRARRHAAPDPALALLIATGPLGRLWERRTTDPDYMSVRIGVGDLESEVVVEDPEQLEHRRRSRRLAYDVPVTVSLRERGVLGIAAADGVQRRLGCWLVAQLAVSQSPRDTQVYVLTDPAGAPDWDWLRWLPHARPQSGQDTLVTMGTDAETCGRRVAELCALAASRRRAQEHGGGARRSPPDVVVVLDGARRLRSLPGVVRLLRHGPEVGIRLVCLDTEERLLPEEATAVVLATADGLTLRQMRVTIVDAVTPDLVEGAWLERTARALAAIRDISGDDGQGVLPAECRLTEVAGLEPVVPEAIFARWALSPRSTAAVLGASLDGPFAVDLGRDGPHALVAGTTGAGKSELLQTLVASLAVANRPDGMSFVLVDYKGGAAFKDCADLPHTVGMVTDLDPHLVRRALTSLGAELTRRERLLASSGAKDIEDYLALAADQCLPGLPRLLIVIDEFASMTRELPDFVRGLVDLAQRGRSLGIHLVLATQRPSGVVSPEIRANTNLRIALRVTDSGESQDVLGAPDSALISKATPGRAHVRLGAQSLVPFQTARVGGRRPGAVSQSPSSPWACEVAAAELAHPAPAPQAQGVSRVEDGAEPTDLRVLVAAIRAAAEQLGLPPPHSPWLPPLTTEVLLPELLHGVAVPPAPEIARIPYALEDLPSRQLRRPAVIDFASFSHLSVVGGPRSGRSQVLRTIAGSVAALTSPADVHLHALDCGNGALLPLVALPHCGVVVQRSEEDRALRLLTRLCGELDRRQARLAATGVASLGELRTAAEPAGRPPHLVLLLDRWEGFLGGLAEAAAGAPYEQVQRLLREGASAGIHLVISGDKQLVNVRMGGLVEHKVGLRLPDKADFALLGLSPRKLPDELPAGRGFRSDSGIELQVALLCADASSSAQAAEIRRLGAAARSALAELPVPARPFKVDVLPDRLTFEDAWRLRPSSLPRPLWALVGVGGDDLVAIGLDLGRTSSAVVAGPPRSGRSTVLWTVAESLLRAGTDVVVAAPRPSPMRDLVGRPGVRAVLTGTEVTTEQLRELMEPGTPVALVIDDGELLKEVAAKDFLRALVRTGGDHGQAVVLGGNSAELGTGFGGWQVDLKGRQGVLLSPGSATEAELIGVRLPRSASCTSSRPGRALVHDATGWVCTIQVPALD